MARREELVRERRRLPVEELAVTRVLDERGAIDEVLSCRDGVSARTVRETIETARRWSRCHAWRRSRMTAC